MKIQAAQSPRHSRRLAPRGRPPTGSRTRASLPGDGRRWRAALTLGALLLASGAAAQSDPFSALRRSMVDEQVRKHGVTQPDVLRALETVPRHLFVPESSRPLAYRDGPVPFAPDKNLSHAIVSARMLELLELDGDERVLEIGTGSGYDAALLSRMAREVYTIEIDGDLAERARETLGQLGYSNVEVKIGDGYGGWPEKAPFDAILVTVSTPEPPPPLYDQLRMGGKMVVAVGSLVQEMQVITKTPEGRIIRPVSLVNLGPMTHDGPR